MLKQLRHIGICDEFSHTRAKTQKRIDFQQHLQLRSEFAVTILVANTLGKLKELVFTGAMIEAKEALSYGLLENVVPDRHVMDAAMELANRIISRGPLGVAAAKKALNRTRDLPLTDGLELESDFWSNLAATEDMKEGARAFIEKRKPNYRCR